MVGGIRAGLIACILFVVVASLGLAFDESASGNSTGNQTLAVDSPTGMIPSDDSSSVRYTRNFRIYASVFYVALIMGVGALLGFRKDKPKDEGKVYTYTQLLILYPSHARQLSEYVSKARAAGHENGAIKSTLVKAGWHENVVVTALHHRQEA